MKKYSVLSLLLISSLISAGRGNPPLRDGQNIKPVQTKPSGSMIKTAMKAIVVKPKHQPMQSNAGGCIEWVHPETTDTYWLERSSSPEDRPIWPHRP